MNSHRKRPGDAASRHIELDVTRSLGEHTHRVCGAKVAGANNQMILAFDLDRETGWILELAFAGGFRQYYPGLSCGLNPLQSVADLKHVVLHWRGLGRDHFDTWMRLEQNQNLSHGEWREYRR